MKSLTTMLAERAATDAHADGLKAWRDTAQAQIAEPVIDACIFSRPTSYGANAIASHSGAIAGMLLRKSREMRAGGLPPHFILAVTADEVIALRRTMTSRGGPLGEPGEEVARWRREDLELSWRPAGYLLHVTIVVRSTAEQIEACVSNGALSSSFMELLADPARVEPAAAPSP